MVDMPSAEETARRKVKGHVESYVMEHGSEDSLNRVVGSLVNGHSLETVSTVFQDYEQSWRRNPDVDSEKLEEVKKAIRLGFGGVEI